MLFSSDNFEFEEKMSDVGDIMRAVEMLLKCLEPELINQDLCELLGQMVV